MKLLKEISEEVTLIEEGTDKKIAYIEGICMQSDVLNKNKRIYPYNILANEANRYITEKINNKTAYGELGHPDTPNINPDRISHRFVSLKSEGKNFVCKAILSETPMGNIARTLMREGGKLGISSRALGSLKPTNEGNIVQDDLKLCTAGDIVIDPSAHDAWIQGIYEQADWVFVPNRGWEQYLDESRKQLVEAASSQLEDVKLKIFENMLKAL